MADSALKWSDSSQQLPPVLKIEATFQPIKRYHFLTKNETNSIIPQARREVGVATLSSLTMIKERQTEWIS